MNDLFFQLIRVAIGTQETLSRLPSEAEWEELFEMAVKQSLVGVCFVGLCSLGADSDEGYARIGISEDLFFDWMGMAAQINMKNELVNHQCVELQKRLAAEGLRSCVLKGQGVAIIYGASLSGFRQTGDIDVWVHNKSIEELVEYVKEKGVTYKATVAHVECVLLEDPLKSSERVTDVELHSEPAFLRCFWNNKKLKKWFRENKNLVYKNELGIVVPTNEFNLVYMMVHMYHHVLFEGMGLRQIIDYYFVLHASCDNDKHNDNVISTLDTLGMMRFAKGIMWIMKEVFALEDRYLICEANEKYGKLILADVMTGGNFGHHDEKNKNLHGGTAVGRSLNGLKRNMKFFNLGPWEVLCSPLWSTWHYFWRKRRNYK